MKRLATMWLTVCCLAGVAAGQPKAEPTTIDLLDAHITAGKVQAQRGGKIELSGGVTIHLISTAKDPKKDVNGTADLTADKITISLQAADPKDKAGGATGRLAAASAEGKVHINVFTDDPTTEFTERWIADVDSVTYDRKTRLIHAANRDGAPFKGTLVRTQKLPPGSTEKPEVMTADLLTNEFEVLWQPAAETKPGA